MLAGLAKNGTDRWASLATDALIDADRAGNYRHVYWDKAREGHWGAIQSLGYWRDDTSLKILEQLASRPEAATPTELEVRARVDRSLRQLRILSNPDWEKSVGPFLTGRGSQFVDWLPWALRVGVSMEMPEMTRLLRTRLDQSTAEFEKLYRSYQHIPNGMDPVEVPAYRRAFTQSFLQAQTDLYFDDVLITFARLRGKLLELETARLSALGYGSDPRTRLNELLAEERN
jgi:hypothetical protein